MGFILFSVLPSTLVPRGGGTFLTTGYLHTTIDCVATPALSQANMFNIAKAGAKAISKFLEDKPS